jgi:hypothetical protein
LRQRSVKIGARIANPIFTIYTQFQGKLVIMGMTPITLLTDRATADSQVEAMGAVEIYTKVRISVKIEVFALAAIRYGDF